METPGIPLRVYCGIRSSMFGATAGQPLYLDVTNITANCDVMNDSFIKEGTSGTGIEFGEQAWDFDGTLTLDAFFKKSAFANGFTTGIPTSDPVIESAE